MTKFKDINLFNEDTVAYLKQFRTSNVVYSGPEGTITVETTESGASFGACKANEVDNIHCHILDEAIAYLKQ